MKELWMALEVRRQIEFIGMTRETVEIGNVNIHDISVVEKWKINKEYGDKTDVLRIGK